MHTITRPYILNHLDVDITLLPEGKFDQMVTTYMLLKNNLSNYTEHLYIKSKNIEFNSQ